MSGHASLHAGYVPAYQMSGVPYLTSSQINLGEVKEFRLPFVTKSILIQNMSKNGNDVISVGFTTLGFSSANSNFVQLSSGESLSGDFRCTKIVISGSGGMTVPFQFIIGLTDIPAKGMLMITGSNGYAGVG
jgi:hypothetical protein